MAKKELKPSQIQAQIEAENAAAEEEAAGDGTAVGIGAGTEGGAAAGKTAKAASGRTAKSAPGRAAKAKPAGKAVAAGKQKQK